jgi:mannose-6-phosphate isomerase-like protein (cupin superfamily)
MHREVNGPAELHVKLNDFFVFLGGEGQIKVGGTVAGEETIGPGEKTGKTLDGGTLYKVKQGDVLFVPANTWHQTLVEPGKKLSAMVMKAE